MLKCFVSQQGAANGLLLIENKGEFLNVVTETQKDWISKITITSYVLKLAKNQEQLPLQRAMREQSCSITANRKHLGEGALQQVKFNSQAFTYLKLAGDLKDVDMSHTLYGNTIYIYFN